MNRRRAQRNVDDDAMLRSVASVGRSRVLVRLVRAVFAIDHLFAWLPFVPGLLLVAVKRNAGVLAAILRESGRRGRRLLALT